MLSLTLIDEYKLITKKSAPKDIWT